MTPKKQEGATQGPTLGQRKSFSSPHPPNCSPGPEGEGLSWPPEREVWKLVSGVARPTGTRHWTGDSAQGYVGTWVQGKVAWLRRYMCLCHYRTGSSFWIHGHLSGPKEWGTPRLGNRDRKKGSEKLPNFRSHSSGAGNRGDQGVSLYLNLRKAEAGPNGKRPLGWGRGRTPRAEQAPPPQTRTLPVPSPRVWGPRSAPFLPFPPVRSG